MRNLDDANTYEQCDPSRMRERISGLPAQCREAHAAARGWSAQLTPTPPERVVVAGMGGSALGAALVQTLVADECRAPFVVWHDYGLPAFASGPATLVIVSSMSGQTEEVLSAYSAASARRCTVVAVCTGGALAERAGADGVPVFRFEWRHQPREAVAWVTLPIVAILEARGLVADKSADVGEAADVLAAANARLEPASPAARNSAKRVAGQFMDRLPIIYGAGVFAPVARRWKNQLNENAKMLAVCDEMPELTHNTVAGLENAQAVLQRSIVIALRGAADSPRTALRYDELTRVLLEAGLNQDTIRAQGASLLAQQLSLLFYGDWVSYYTAVISGIDPTPVDAIADIKAAMARR